MSSRASKKDKKISPHKKRSEKKQHIISAQEFHGPIPPPSILNGYEDVCPGAADRIIALAENEQKHRHDAENKFIDAEIQVQNKSFIEARVGQICALLVGLSTIASATLCAYFDQPWTGTFIGGSGIVGLVSVFIYGRKGKPCNGNGDDE